MKKLYIMIGYIYTKLIIGVIQLLSLFNLIKGGEFGFPPKNTILIWTIWILLFFVIIILNIMELIKCFLQNDYDSIKAFTYKIKIFLIPYWIINFIISGAYWGVLIGSSHGFGMFLLPVPFISAIFIFSLTSIYSILFVIVCWKKDQLKNHEFLLYLFSQFIFVLDIIAIILLRNKFKINKSQEVL